MTWCCDARRSRIAMEVAMDAKTPIIAATATAMSSHMVRGERLPFDCSVMKVRSKTPEYQGLLYAATLFALDNRTTGLPRLVQELFRRRASSSLMVLALVPLSHRKRLSVACASASC